MRARGRAADDAHDPTDSRVRRWFGRLVLADRDPLPAHWARTTAVVLVFSTLLLGVAIGFDKVTASEPSVDAHTDLFVKGDVDSLLPDSDGFDTILAVTELGPMRVTGSTDATAVNSSDRGLLGIQGCPASSNLLPGSAVRASGTVQSGAAAYRIARSASGWAMASARVYLDRSVASTAFAAARDLVDCDSAERSEITEWTTVLASGSSAAGFSYRTQDATGEVDRACYRVANAVACYATSADQGDAAATAFISAADALIADAVPFRRPGDAA